MERVAKLNGGKHIKYPLSTVIKKLSEIDNETG